MTGGIWKCVKSISIKAKMMRGLQCVGEITEGLFRKYSTL
jgi:hypothetical protein